MVATRERAILMRGRSRVETCDSPRARHRQVYEITRRHCFVIPLLHYLLYFFTLSIGTLVSQLERRMPFLPHIIKPI